MIDQNIIDEVNRLDSEWAITVWKNKKNDKEYIVMFVSVHTETEEIFINYQKAGTNDITVFSRPLNLFLEKFERV